MNILDEGLYKDDLKYLVLPIVSIDEYTPKLNSDNLVLAFFTKERDAANDLKEFIEKIFFDEIDDIEIADSLTINNNYILFVEINRTPKNVSFIMNLLDIVSVVSGVQKWSFKTFGLSKPYEASEENIKNYIRLVKEPEQGDL